jgi:hypothetical protein
VEKILSSQAALLRRLTETAGAYPPSRPLPWRLGHAVRQVLAADGASITLENSSPGRVTPCATDRRAYLLEDAQEVLGEGPSPDAFTTGRPVVASLAQPGPAPWPRFMAAAKRIIGPRGVLWSVPMRATGDILGTLSLYRLAPGPLAEPPDGAQFLADATGRLLLTDPLAFMESPVGGGWSSRAVIHQATGMLIAQLGVHAEGALAILRCYACNRGAELVQVARDVVERKLDLSRRRPPPLPAG